MPQSSALLLRRGLGLSVESLVPSRDAHRQTLALPRPTGLAEIHLQSLDHSVEDLYRGVFHLEMHIVKHWHYHAHHFLQELTVSTRQSWEM